MDNKNIIRSWKNERIDVFLDYITGYEVRELVEVEGTLNTVKYIKI